MRTWTVSPSVTSIWRGAELIQRANYNVRSTHVQMDVVDVMDVTPWRNRIIRSTLDAEHAICFRSRRLLASINPNRWIPLTHPASSRVAATVKSIRNRPCSSQFPNGINCRSSTCNGPSLSEFVVTFGFFLFHRLSCFRLRGEVFHAANHLRNTPFDRSHHQR